MIHSRLRNAGAVLFALVLAAVTATLIFSGAATADPSGVGGTPGMQLSGGDPPLSSFASVPLTTPGGTIQSTIYDGANTEVTGGTLSQTFTVPPSQAQTKTTVVMADGQLPGNAFTLSGSGPPFADPNAFPGNDPHPAGWSFGGLWDTRNYDVSSTMLPGDTSAAATASGGGDDCLTWVAQVFASGSPAAFTNAGYAAAGAGLRDQGSGNITIAGIPAGANYIARALLYWANINPSNPGGAMMIDGHSTASTLNASDASPCWPPNSTQSIFAWRANVTPFVSGNGSYHLSGYPTALTGGQDPWANQNASPFMEGASLLVFYGQASLTANSISATEGAPFSGKVATFTEPDASASAGQYTATIDWGDSSTSSGTVSGPVGGPFTVNGSHTYQEEGAYPVHVTIVDNNNSANTYTDSATATVGDAALTAGTLSLSGGVEGSSPGSASFTFTDANPFATTADFTATIDWGDGTTTTGSVSGPTGGPFHVDGSHQYTEEGTYTVTVSVADDGGSTTSASGSTTVTDAPLTSACAAPATSLQAFTGPTATFTDANAFGTSADFTATINWGDSTTTSGAITGGPGTSPYTVSGAHTYTSTGNFTITTSIVDDGGSSTTTSCTVLVFAFAPGGGGFAIGDLNSANGTPVTFWGAQWWKLNSLSGGAAPASFKGFALNPSTPSCGIDWSTRPGNSAPPPAGPLPAFMGVIVTSSSSKSGPTISGDTAHIVVVQTNPGYRNDPGHPGTGTVVAQVC